MKNRTRKGKPSILTTLAVALMTVASMAAAVMFGLEVPSDEMAGENAPAQERIIVGN